MISDFEEMEKALKQFPDAPVGFLLRNYNKSDEISLFLKCPDVHVYCEFVNIRELFPVLQEWVKENTSPNGMISVENFINSGKEIATLLGREFQILHQYGSGKPEYAYYKDYIFSPVS